MTQNSPPKPKFPDIEGLKAFVRENDRSDPIRFVGRTDEFNDLRDRLQDLSWKWWRGDTKLWKGETRGYQGAPGAGKTAFLEHLRSMRLKHPSGYASLLGGMPVDACIINNLNVMNNMQELKDIIEAVWFPNAESDPNSQGSTSFSFKVLSLAVKKIMKSKMGWSKVLQKVKGNPKQYSPILLMVDEAQKMDDAAKNQLLWLHQGNEGLPIIPVFGGLAWTVDRLDELGISRASLRHASTLDRLEKKECMEAVQAFFDKYRIIGNAREREKWAGWIADESMGWPQHLHVGLQGLAEALIKAGGVLTATNRTKALKGGEERRNEYYEERIGSPRLKEKRYLAAAAIDELGKSQTVVTLSEMGGIVQGISDKEGEANPYNKYGLPRKMEADDFADAMLKAGLLHKRKKGALHIPIPCFEKYLKDNYPLPTLRKPDTDCDNSADPGGMAP